MIHLDIAKKMFSSEGERSMEVEVDIPDNSITCISGVSGVGKTTLIRMIAGLVKPDRGIIRIDEKVLFDSSRNINLISQKRSVGFMFQDYALFPNMNVRKNIEFGQSDKNRDPEFVSHLLLSFGLEGLSNQRVTKLSGGQRQRVALARALASKPSVLLLDEPLSAVDREMRSVLQAEIIKAHRILGTTTLVITHDTDDINCLGTHLLHLTTDKVFDIQSIERPNVRFEFAEISHSASFCEDVG